MDQTHSESSRNSFDSRNGAPDFSINNYHGETSDCESSILSSNYNDHYSASNEGGFPLGPVNPTTEFAADYFDFEFNAENITAFLESIPRSSQLEKT